jgi:glycosyltransferase involved in cell wall biosynthesis
MIDSKPLVSVGIPTYNRPAGLERTLNQITKQTYSNLEIIVSDNCSPNVEVEKVVNTFLKDQRVKYFRQKTNITAFPNFRFVLKKAHGEYFFWAADDDEWAETYVEELVELLEINKGSVVAFCNYHCIVDNNQISQTFFHDLQIANGKKPADLVKLAIAHKIPAHLIYGIFRLNNCKKVFEIMEKRFVWNYFASDQVFNFLILSSGEAMLKNKILYKTNISSDSLSYNSHKGSVSEVDFLKGLIKGISSSRLNLLDKILCLYSSLKSLVYYRSLNIRIQFVEFMKKKGIHKYYLGIKKFLST